MQVSPQRSLLLALLGMLLAFQGCKKDDCLLTGDCEPSTYQSTSWVEQPVPVASGNIYYIDAEGGNDENSGLSESAAWQTTSNIRKTDFQPGDHIYFRRDQLHFGQLTLDDSGTENDRIVISSYGSGEAPIVKHSNPRETAFFLDGADYVTIQNLNIHGGYTAIALEEADYAIIEGCRIGENSTVGIKASARDDERDGSDHGMIRYCLIYSALEGAVGDLQGTDGIQLGDGASYWEVYLNEIKDWAHTGINVYQIFSTAEEAYNKIYANIFKCDGIDYMRAFSFQGGENGPHHNEFYSNRIFGQTTASHLHGHQNIVCYNIFDGIALSDASTQPHAVDFHVFRNRQRGAEVKDELLCRDNQFFNNLILNCEGPAIVFFKPMNGTVFTVTNNTVRNNLVVNSTVGIQMPPDDYRSTITNNLFYSPNGSVSFSYDDNLESLTQFEARDGQNGDVISNNLEADPLLRILDPVPFGIANYSLENGSPAIDAGAPHDWPTDHYLLLIDGTPDIGAVEKR